MTHATAQSEIRLAPRFEETALKQHYHRITWITFKRERAVTPSAKGYCYLRQPRVSQHLPEETGAPQPGSRRPTAGLKQGSFWSRVGTNAIGRGELRRSATRRAPTPTTGCPLVRGHGLSLGAGAAPCLSDSNPGTPDNPKGNARRPRAQPVWQELRPLDTTMTVSSSADDRGLCRRARPPLTGGLCTGCPVRHVGVQAGQRVNSGENLRDTDSVSRPR